MPLCIGKCGLTGEDFMPGKLNFCIKKNEVVCLTYYGRLPQYTVGRNLCQSKEDILCGTTGAFKISDLSELKYFLKFRS